MNIYQGFKRSTVPAVQHIAEPLTWDTCVKYESRLLNLVHRIEAIKNKSLELKGKRKLTPSYADKCWYGHHGRQSIKTQLNDLIGWSSNSPYHELRTPTAHNICYHHLYKLLNS